MTYPELLRNALDKHLPMARALELLRASGASPIEAVRAVEQVTGTPHEDAQALVDESGAWVRPRPGVSLGAAFCEWHGAIGEHGRSGQGADSVLPHLARQAQSQAGSRGPRR